VTYTYPTVKAYVDPQYSWNGTIPYTQDGTATCVQSPSGTTAPLPSISDLPTQAVQQIDPVDQAGWTYCYQPYADLEPVNQSFYSLFDGLDDIFVDVSNASNCQREWTGAGPVQAVSQVAFLFQETTSYINDPVTTKTSSTPSSSDGPSKSSILADPFAVTSHSTSTEAALSSSSKATVVVSVFHETTSSEKPSILESKTDGQVKTSAITSSVPPVESDNNADPANGQTQPTKSEDVDTKPTSQGLATSSPKIEDNGAPLASASPTTSPFENLNSLINVVAAGQSSSPASSEAPNANSAGGPQPNPTPDTTTAVTANSAGSDVVISQTTRPGEPAHQSEGATHAADTNGGESTAKEAPTDIFNHPQVTQGVSSVLTFGDATATVNAASEYVFGDQTLKPGSSAIVISGTSISLVQSATAVVFGGGFTVGEASSGIVSHPQVTQAVSSILVFGDATATVNAASEYVFGDQTLKPGSSAIVVSGTSISLVQGATAVVLGPEIATPTNANTAQELTVGGVVVTAIPIGTKTKPLEPSNTALSATTGEATGGAITTAAVPSEYLVAGQTVRPGAPAITVSGTRVSLAPGATALVVGTETKNLQSTTGVGDYIWSGIAGALSEAQASSASASESTGVSTASGGSVASGPAVDSTSTDVFHGSSSTETGTSRPTAGSLGSSTSSPSSSSSSVTESASGGASQPRITTAVLLLAIGVCYLSL
jgi:hypothetical protein